MATELHTINWAIYSKNQVIEVAEAQSRVVNTMAEALISPRLSDADCRMRLVELLQIAGVLSRPEPSKPKLELVEPE